MPYSFVEGQFNSARAVRVRGIIARSYGLLFLDAGNAMCVASFCCGQLSLNGSYPPKIPELRKMIIGSIMRLKSFQDLRKSQKNPDEFTEVNFETRALYSPDIVRDNLAKDYNRRTPAP